MKLSRTNIFLIVIAFTIPGLYSGNAAWLAASQPGERLITADRGLHQTYAPTGVKSTDCTASVIDAPVHDYLENTLPSIEAATDLGANIVEIDIHPTTDGE